MLLSCCFREPKNKKNKNKDNAILQEFKASPPPSPALTVHSATLRGYHGQDRILSKEKHPPSKEEKRLMKKISQESLQRRSIISENAPSQRSSIIITDKSNNDHLTSTNLSTIHNIQERKDSLPTPPATPKKIIAKQEDSWLSATNLIETSLTSSNCHKGPSCLILTSTPVVAGDAISSSAASVTTSQASIRQKYSEMDQNTVERKDREAEVLQKQIQREEEANRIFVEENIIYQLKMEHDLLIQHLKDQHQAELNKEKGMFILNLNNEIKSIKQENEETILNVKNKANFTISKINQQIVLERGKMIAEQQENARNLEQEFTMKHERVKASSKLIEEREQAWKDEKDDVLKEVQRLKAEATRMVKILAMEYEGDNLSEDKRRSLSQEVYSLQLVVEMRTGEVRNLREQLNRATQQLEEAEVTKEKLEKATARMEDLEEQLKVKHQLQRQISVEKNQLEMSVINSNKAAARMSQNVEELQWRIRNHFDVPVAILPSPICQQQKQPSLTGFCEPNDMSLNNLVVHQDKQSTPIPGRKSTPQSQKLSFFTVSPDMLKATAYEETVIEDCVDIGDTSDFSPCYDGIAEIVLGDDNHSDSDNIDGDSLDEGLGDTSSDESAESPFPIANNLDGQQSYQNINSVQAIPISANCNSLSKTSDNDQSQFNPSCEKERRPSRLSFETSL